MLFLFFDALSEELLHVCQSDAEFDEFVYSEFCSFLEETKGSDFVCYRVPDSALFKFAKDYNLK